MKYKLLYLLIFALNFNVLKAQEIPTIITNSTIHVGNGLLLEKATIVFNLGKIVFVGNDYKSIFKNATIINGEGKHVYPGIICLNNYVGLTEIEAVRATHDFYENGLINPNVRSQIAYNTDSKILPTIKFNGILMVQSVPQGGLISGTSSIMKTDGWNWEDATVKADDGIHLNWPEYASGNAEKQKEQVEKRVNELSAFFEAAFQYQKIVPEVYNVRLEAMRGLFNKTKKLYLHVNTAKGIINSVMYFQNKYPTIQLVLVDVNEISLCIDFVKEKNIPVVLSNIHSLPSLAHKDVDQPFKNAALLQKAGIVFAISHKESWQTRNLMFNAGTTVAYGLTNEQALQAVTLNAAKIVGIDSTYGSLEVGKSATIIISSGDVLDMKTNDITNAFINGEAIVFKNEQKDLNDKFLKKYDIKN